MKIIIDIQDEKYNLIKSELYNTLPAEIKEWGAEAIRNGTIILNCDDCKTPCIMYEKGMQGCKTNTTDVLDKIRVDIEHLTITEGDEDYIRKMAELYSLKN